MPAARASDRRSRAPRRATLGPFGVALLIGATTAVGQAPPAPLFRGGEGSLAASVGPAPAGTGRGRTEDCAACHVEIAREWAASQHREAWTDEVFQRAYELEPMPFCRHCHAPLAPPGAAPLGPSAREGVSCAACHVRGGVVLSSGSGRGDAVGASAPHAVRADPRFATSAYCAGCHQFNFPAERVLGGALFDSHAPMQDTFGEWSRSASAAAGAPCASCHMPLRTSASGRPYRSHAFPGARDAALLASAARVEASAEREGEGDRSVVVVRARVWPGAVGHAFPTGDLFRRLELRVWLDGRPETERRVSFARVFEDRFERLPSGEHAFVRREVGDARVQPPGQGAPRESVLTFEGASVTAARAVRWRLDHLLMPSPQAATQGVSEARVRAVVQEGAFALPAVQRRPPGGPL